MDELWYTRTMKYYTATKEQTTATRKIDKSHRHNVEQGQSTRVRSV